jgi:hypothetical protein
MRGTAEEPAVPRIARAVAAWAGPKRSRGVDDRIEDATGIL